MTVVIERLTEQDPDPVEAPPAPKPNRITSLLATRTDLLITGLLVTVIVAVQAVNIGNFPTVSDDEGTYLAQAWAIQHGHGLAHYSYWYDHPPLGWIQIAMLSWIPALFDHGANVVMNARVIMLPVTAVASALVYVLARRVDLPRWAAALATVIFGLSPLSVTMQREIYLDNFAVAWMLGAFVFALSPRRHLWHHIAAGLCAAVAVLSKETMVVVFPALIMAVWRGSDRATRKFTLVGFLAVFSLVAFQYLLYALLKGELLPGAAHNSLIGGIEYQLSRGGSGFILQRGSVSNMTMHWWLVRDPILIYAGVIASALAMFVRQVRLIALASCILLLVAARPNGYLPAMYVIQVLPFLALCIAGVAHFGVRWLLTVGQQGSADPAAGPSRIQRVLARLRSSRFRVGRRDLIAFLAVIVVGLVAPHWETGDETADTSLTNENYVAASAWIKSNIADPAHTRIVVDDALWPDMVGSGFRPGLGAIWFYKVDLDPAVTRTLPHGYRDLDYVVSTSIIRQDPNGLPTVREAIKHSKVVASFGVGDQSIQILRVDRTGGGQ